MNNATKQTSYELPRVVELFDLRCEIAVLLTLDKYCGDYAVAIETENRDKTVFASQHELIRLVRKLSQTRNAPSTFQQTIVDALSIKRYAGRSFYSMSSTLSSSLFLQWKRWITVLMYSHFCPRKASL